MKLSGGEAGSSSLWAAVPGAVLAAGALAWSLWTYGPTMAQTGLHNLAAAEGLLTGAPMTTSRGELFSLWPPLMPLVFALAAKLGVAASTTALVGNVLASFVLLLSVGCLLLRASGSWIAVVVAQLFLVTSTPLFRSFATIQTEPWFLALVTSGAWFAVRYADGGGPRYLVLAAILLALSALQRYVGAVFALVIGLFLMSVWKDLPLRQRLVRSGLFLLSSAAPLLVWMARNALSGERLSGVRDESDLGYRENAATAGATVLGWFLPDAWPSWSGWLLAGLLAAGASLALARGGRAARLAATIAVVYPGFMVVYGSNSHLDPLHNRLMLPCLPFLVVCFAAGFGWLLARAHGFPRLAGWVGLSVLGSVSLFSAPKTVDLMVAARERGLGGIVTKEWQESELVALLRTLQLTGPVFSNLPELVTYYAHIPAESLPARGLKRAIKDSCLTEQEGHIVWVAPDGAPAFRPGRRIEFHLVAECREGAVYRTQPARE